MAPSLTLYGDPFSANTRIVTIVLEMLELKYEFRSIDVMHGDHLSSNFQKVGERCGELIFFKLLEKVGTHELRSPSERFVPGCVNSPPLPEAGTMQIHATYRPTF